jgi:stage II sporulation protein D
MTFGFCKEALEAVKRSATVPGVMLRLALLASALLALCVCGAGSAVLLEVAPTTTTATTALATTTAATTTTFASTTFASTTTAPTTTTTATTTAPATTSAPVPVIGKPAVTFVLSGHGWGHGAGLSQWGAKGYAEHGWTYDAILAHYYTGTQLGPAPVAQVRVLLVEGAKSLTLASSAAWSVVDAEGQSHELAPGKLVLGVGLKVQGTALVPPLSFQPGSAPLQVAGKPYRGTIGVQKGTTGKLLAIDTVGLEDYLRGVVPAEMPSSWPAEALKAQAVAARTYALSSRATSKPYDLYADTRSQVYLGLSTEVRSTSAAIDATAGQVVLYQGKPISALFSSSSGGRTAAQSEVFPGGKPVPYLASVPDPYDASPYKNWTATVDGGKAATALGLKGTVLDLSPVTGVSGRVVTATLTLPTGQSIVTGSSLRSALGLRSTWFTPALMSLTPPPAAITYGQSATLTGIVRGLPSPLLELRSGSVFWAAGPPLQVAGDGSFTLVLKPQRTTDVRLGSGSIRATPARVTVAPAVRLAAGLSGTVKPAVPGKPVQVQQQVGTRWQTVTTVAVDAAGAFPGSSLGSGTFRARYAPGGGLVAGVSAPLVVP